LAQFHVELPLEASLAVPLRLAVPYHVDECSLPHARPGFFFKLVRHLRLSTAYFVVPISLHRQDAKNAKVRQDFYGLRFTHPLSSNSGRSCTLAASRAYH